MYELKKDFTICCSHRLNNEKLTPEVNKEIFGKCNNEPSHGHNYKITLTLRKEHLSDDSGMVMNFDFVKKVFKKEIDDVYDHKFLNDMPEFKGKITTAENMAKVFYSILKKQIWALYKIEIEETDGASASYWVDEDEN